MVSNPLFSVTGAPGIDKAPSSEADGKPLGLPAAPRAASGPFSARRLARSMAPGERFRLSQLGNRGILGTELPYLKGSLPGKGLGFRV